MTDNKTKERDKFKTDKEKRMMFLGEADSADKHHE